MLTKSRATINDLYRVEGKAEVVNGEIVHMEPTGDDPAQASFEVAIALKQYVRENKRGLAVPDDEGGPPFGLGGDETRRVHGGDFRIEDRVGRRACEVGRRADEDLLACLRVVEDDGDGADVKRSGMELPSGEEAPERDDQETRQDGGR